MAEHEPGDEPLTPGPPDEDFLAGRFSPGGIASVSGASPATIGIGPVMFEPKTSSPLESDEADGVIPAEVLWAMKDRRHALQMLGGPDAGPIHCQLGADESAVYAIDDGRFHCMIGHLVGRAPDGCTYSLVARIPLVLFAQLNDGEVPLEQAFLGARDIALCGVFKGQGTASNVLIADHYRRAKDIPKEYLPGSPFIEFTDA